MVTPYLTNEEADSRISGLFLTEDRQAWVEATQDDRTTALSQATRDIDSLAIAGSPAVAGQPQQFPRGSDTVPPEAILDACVMIAVVRLDGKRPEEEVENLGLVSTGYAAVKATYDFTSAPEHLAAGIVSFEAWRLIRPFLRDPGTFRQSRVS